MGAKQSTNAPRMRTFSSSGQGSTTTTNGAGSDLAATSAASIRARARSLGSFHNGAHSPSLSIPNNNGGGLLGAMSPDSDSSTPDEGPFGRAFTHSLPVHLSFALPVHNLTHRAEGHTAEDLGIKCPVCSKFVPPDDLECHLVICLTKPRISYNEDVLTEDKGECVICLEDLQQGDTIARLPCLCIYHKTCIDRWFEVNRSCPEHPSD